MAFPHLPSVGTWLRVRRPVTQFAADTDERQPQTDLTGRWRCISGQVYTIASVSFPDLAKDPTLIEFTVDGDSDCFQADHVEGKILWACGDVWERPDVGRQ